eukprot:scaffold184739_cov41-Tisochrysis_lutea.AAC.1
MGVHAFPGGTSHVFGRGSVGLKIVRYVVRVLVPLGPHAPACCNRPHCTPRPNNGEERFVSAAFGILRFLAWCWVF